MALRWDDKDPDDVLDYEVSWLPNLSDGDTISTSTFTIPTTDGSLVIDSQTNTDEVSKVWLSAGTIGYTYTVLCRVVTVAGRTMDQSVNLTVTAR